jgi:hypothetical protein
MDNPTTLIPIRLPAPPNRPPSPTNALAIPADTLTDTSDPGDIDTLDALGERIALHSAQIQAATYQLLVMIYQFDLRAGWDSGFHTCAHWLHWRTGLSLPAAREKVRVARALPDLPRISQAMSEGRLSYSKVRAITRVATPDNEEELLVFAEAGTAAHVERLVRAWRRVDRQAEIDDDERRHASRSLSAWVDEDGMVVVRGRLSPEVGAVLLRALDAAEERLFDLGKKPSEAVNRDDTTGAQRRADALGLIAEAALAHNLDPGTRGDRYQVVVHVDASTLSASEPGRQGQAALQDGQRVSGETSRRIACDAATLEMVHDAQGGVIRNILDIGRKTRAIPTPIRRALDHRDQGCCRFPGCEVTHCEAHHIEHWADGGETKLGNLALLCKLFRYRNNGECPIRCPPERSRCCVNVGADVG